jgi:tagatose-6-phosphate ketose/aldose isomerase
LVLLRSRNYALLSLDDGVDGILSKFPTTLTSSGQAWLQEMARRQTRAAQLLAAPEQQQHSVGYFHTLREILQQPATWLETSEQMAALAGELSHAVEGIKTLTLTGSGSSEYAGECVVLPLQNELLCSAEAIGGGALLTYGGKAMAAARPGLMVSLARSGDSPESAGALSLILETEPAIRHLVITCNKEGRLATNYQGDPRVHVVVLAKETNDRSLVMTSSFTNMVLAARFLGMLSTPAVYRTLAQNLSRIAEDLLLTHFDTLAELGERNFNRVLYLGSGTRLGAAREASLKMLEMTAGRIWANCETYLGLRHGPLSAVHTDSLVVCCLSSDPLVRAYECDLIRELNEKGLGMAKLIFGENVPADLAREEDVVIECAGLAAVGDDQVPILYALVGQVLALFRCMADGLQPDSPSRNGVINRVVSGFVLHRAAP